MSEERLEEARAGLRRAFAGMRRQGGHFYQEYLALEVVQAEPPQAGMSMAVGVQHSGAGGIVSPGALATLADVALAAALRRSVKERARLLTVDLGLQIVGEQGAGRVHALSEAVAVTSREGMALCRMVDPDSRVLAVASGTFAIRPVAEEISWRAGVGGPLSDAEIAAVDLDTLSSEEQWLRTRVEAGLRGAGRDGAYAGFLGIRWQRRGGGRAEGSWPLGPHLWNRSGNVHGGALFGALAEAALACLPADEPKRVIDQHVQFVRPGRGSRLRVEARLHRRGQQFSSAQATITDEDDHTVASALVTVENGKEADSYA